MDEHDQARATRPDDDAALRIDSLDLARRIVHELEASQEAAPVSGAGVSSGPAASGATPEQIGGYHIEAVLGTGGGGTVYRAMRNGSQSPVALKVLHKRLDGSPGSQRAWRELTLLSQLRLRCLPQIHDYGETDDGRLYIVTDFVDGQALLDHCSQQDLSLRQRVELLADICDCCQMLHEYGVIHRDIKPSNIIINPHGQVIIIDLGVATLLADDVLETLTAEGQPIGSPAYMSPEQARGERAMLSTRSDVYGLGATAYRVLTGQVPHDMEASLHEVIRRVAQDSARDPRHLRADLPRPLAAVLHKAVSHRPSDRYESAAAMADDLRRWLRGDPVEAGGVKFHTAARSLLRQHPIATATLGVLIAAMGASLPPLLNAIRPASFPGVVALSPSVGDAVPAVTMLAPDYPVASFAKWLAVVGDIDGDGIDDIAISAPTLPNRSRDPWLSQAGGILLITGEASQFFTGGSPDVQQLVSRGQARWILGEEPRSRVGPVFDVGDVNNDGFNDFAFSSRREREAASPYSVLTIAFGAAGCFEDLGRPLTTLDLVWGDETSEFGSWASSFHPDPDGSPRILIGAPRSNGRSGEMFVLTLDRALLMQSVIDEQAVRSHSVAVSGAVERGEFGRFFDYGGDFNGDGRPDLLVTAPCNDESSEAGTVHVITDLAQLNRPGGTRLELGDIRTIEIFGEDRNDWFGVMARWCDDFNADGFDDIVVGAVQAARAEGDGGRAYVIGGSASSTHIDVRNSRHVLLSLRAENRAVGAGDHLGSVVVPLGDVNGDGFADIAVTAPRANTPMNDAGCVFVVFGSIEPRVLDPLLPNEQAGLIVLRGSATGDGCGTFAAASDLDLDGRVELLIGAPGADGHGRSDTGAMFFLEIQR